MNIVRSGDVWLLVDESAPPEARTIAVLRDKVEALALAEYASRLLADPGAAAGRYTVALGACRYEVAPATDRGGRLTLNVRGYDGSLRRIETEFRVPPDGNSPGSDPQGTG